MNGFIDVIDITGVRHLINVRHIEEIADEEERCTIYMAYHTPDADDKDYFTVNMPLDEIKKLLEG